MSRLYRAAKQDRQNAVSVDRADGSTLAANLGRRGMCSPETAPAEPPSVKSRTDGATCPGTRGSSWEPKAQLTAGPFS